MYPLCFRSPVGGRQGGRLRNQELRIKNQESKRSVSQKSLYLIDTPNIIFRAYHALPPLTNSRGFPTSAVHGVANMLLKLLREHKPDAVVAAYDPSTPTFRDAMFSEYKGTRKETPSDLTVQFPVVRRMLDGFRIPQFELEGFEADDVIASLACTARDAGWKVVIVSSDKDLMQLVGGSVFQLDTMKDKYYDRDGVVEKWGVPPEKLGDVLALMGDAVDNVPGIPGIGEKTAVKLITEFGSLENLLKSTGALKGKMREKVETHQDAARLSRRLVQLKEDCELPVRLEELGMQEPDRHLLSELFNELEMKKLSTEFALAEGEEAAPRMDAVAVPHRIVRAAGELRAALQAAAPGSVWSVELVAEPEDARFRRPAALVAAPADGEALVMPLGAEWKDAAEALHTLLARTDVRLVSTDAKGILLGLLATVGDGALPAIDDVGIMSYLVNPSLPAHALEKLCDVYLGRKLSGWESVCGQGRAARKFADVPPEELAPLAAARAQAALAVLHEIEPILIREHLMDLYLRIERPLTAVLARMEHAGICVDRDQLVRQGEELATAIAAVEAEIRAIAGPEFNPNSPRQLGEIMFEKLGYSTKGIRKTKTGQYSTDSEVLEKLALEYPLPRLILHYRSLAKLKGTYVDALQTLIEPDGRIHTRFNQLVAATGRLSSSDPNLQNIPIRDEEGRKIRRAFTAAPGMRLMSFDYSQVELRLLAHIADDAILQESFAQNEDVHRRTAAEVFGVEPEQVDDAMRRKAKAVNFGIAYGQTAYGLSAALNIGQEEAQGIINRYFERYQGVKKYLQLMPELARKQGYVTTLFGRRRMLPDIHNKNHQIRQFAERTAINTPIQGSAADLIKVAMLRIDEIFSEKGWQSRMLLQVHDELLFEVAADEADAVRETVRDRMEHVMSLKVPLVVDIGEGFTWAEAHG